MIQMVYSEASDYYRKHVLRFDSQETEFTVWRHLTNSKIKDGTTPVYVRVFFHNETQIEADMHKGLPLQASDEPFTCE